MSTIDPDDLESVDQQIRINELRERLSEMGGRSEQVNPDCPPEIQEQFLQNIMAYETAEFTTHFKQLQKAGVELPSPESLDDESLTRKLWEMIEALARLSVFLDRTDHLSDRELYTHLWNESLREETPDFPPGSGWKFHLDILGGCSEEDMFLSRKYYDSEEERQRWAKDWPQDEMPPHEDPPFDRDSLLPKPDHGPPQEE